MTDNVSADAAGIRHPVIRVAIRFRGTVYSLPAPNRHHDNDEQGFLDATGRFLSRRQALANARHNGQVSSGFEAEPDKRAADCSQLGWRAVMPPRLPGGRSAPCRGGSARRRHPPAPRQAHKPRPAARTVRRPPPT